MHVRDPFLTMTNDEVKAVAGQHALPFAVAIPNLSSLDLNTGAIIRSACALGAQCVFLFGRRKYDRRPTIGTHHYIDVLSFPQDNADAEFDWQYLLETVRTHDYTPVIIEQGGEALHHFDGSAGGPYCLVLGAESHPVPHSVCQSERWYAIPQPGVGRSLNTAVAASIAMHHMVCCIYPYST